MMIALFILLVVAMLITSFCLGGKIDKIERKLMNDEDSID